jgi:phospholipid/cholesterol/gamma-HCH transport system ATP-binding protein
MIQLRALRKRLGTKQVLDGVDLEIATGETMVIMGRSGTGKSVLLKHIIGLMHPDSGSIDVDGQVITSLKEKPLNEVRKRFGMLFQGSALFDSMTVGENVAFPMREHMKLRESEIRQRTRERLDWVGLEKIEEQKPASLSGGMKKRVGLARAIAIDPKYILYDEPTTGLDPVTAENINKLIRSLQERLGLTSIVVTHDLQCAWHVGDHIALLHEGRVVYEGTPDDAKDTDDPLMREFIEASNGGPARPV